MKRLSIRHLGYAVASLFMLAFPYLSLALFILVIGVRKFREKKTVTDGVLTLQARTLPELSSRPKPQRPKPQPQTSRRRRLAVDAIKLRVAQQCESTNPQLRLQALDLARHVLSLDKKKMAQMSTQQVVARLREGELTAVC